MSEFRARQKGSCRFSPYYKAQYYDEKTLSWRDIAKQFETKEMARKSFDKLKKWRVMVVTMRGREVV
jgi:hypothetical protein